MRACAEIAESAVPAMETPRLPRKRTNTSSPKTGNTGTLNKMENTGSISNSVRSRKSVFAESFAANIAKGSAEPNRNKVGKVTKKQVEEIAKIKLVDLNTTNLESAVRTVMGTARNMGLEVVEA